MKNKKNLSTVAIIISTIIVVVVIGIGIGTSKVKCEDLGTSRMDTQCVKKERCTRSFLGINLGTFNRETEVDCLTGVEIK